MDLADALTGLDDRPWAALQHAYGSAEDVPALLRALTDDDAEAAGEALHELYGTIWHQGTVYAATVEAVPFLARLAAAGCRSAELLVLLGCMAESDDEHEVARGACRGAVADGLPLVLPLLDSEDPKVRQAAAWVSGHTAARDRAWPALERRWAVERDPVVRAELLTAMARLDPAASADTAVAALDASAPAEVRMAGVLACLDAGLPWDAALLDAALSVLPAHDLVSERLDEGRREPLRAVVDVLLRRDTDEDREGAFVLLEAALAIPAPEVRAEAVWAADGACMISRAAPARLLPRLVPLLDDPSSAPAVLRLLYKVADLATGPVADTLAEALTRIAAGADAGDMADSALAALVTVDPARAARLLAGDLPRRPRALAVASGARDTGTAREATPPFEPLLLDAVRRRLADPEVRGNEPIHLTLLLTSWGTQASAAVPEVLDALPRIPLVGPKALVALCPTEGPVRGRIEDRLREAADQGPKEGHLAAAHALYELTGDAAPLLTAVRSRLGGRSYDVRDAAGHAAELGAAGAELVTDLRAALSDPGQQRVVPQLDADVQLAEALWRITGDATEAVGILDTVLAESDGPWFTWTGVRAARLAARLGPAARPLRPALERMLATPLHAPACTLALLATGVEEELRPTPADPVLVAAEHNADPDTAFEALLSLGRRHLTDGRLNRLVALADGDRRVVDSGLEDQIIRADERLRARARATLSALDGQAAAQ
ncbi:HEAT repeat domain-containing protein [Streptomyces sp. NPDC049627]|uniref:HEAT repeat domain-containing protein n=1 Tax=Streptomyces sp. NPDC049627 TaxID=3365595 RepID=UPI003795F357